MDCRDYRLSHEEHPSQLVCFNLVRPQKLSAMNADTQTWGSGANPGLSPRDSDPKRPRGSRDHGRVFALNYIKLVENSVHTTNT